MAYTDQNAPIREAALLRAHILQLETELMRSHQTLDIITHSTYWKITSPIRLLLEGIKFVIKPARRYLAEKKRQKAAQQTGIPAWHFFADQAHAWKSGRQMPPADCAGKKVSIWCARHGNTFFYEIAELLKSGFAECGMHAEAHAVSNIAEYLADQESDLHVIVAPHEFYYFFRNADSAVPPKTKLWLYNTEQMHTAWFADARIYFGKADLVLDLDWNLTAKLRTEGLPVEHLPLLYAPTCRLFDGWNPPECNEATETLPLAVRNAPCAADPMTEKLADRPLDCFFIGIKNDRRVQFFADNAALFAELHAFLRMEDLAHGPTTYGENSPMTTQIVSSLARRSKVLLNIHQSEHTYFEWHRIVLQGMWHGTVVISEPCTDSWPFLPDEDFMVASLKEMPDVLEYLVKSPEGQQYAEKIRRHAWQTLHRYLLKERIESLLVRYFAREKIS